MVNLTRARFLRQIVLGLAATVTLAACGGGSSDSAGDQVLIVATEPAFPPFEAQAANGELEGFDIDLMKAIAAEAGLEVQFESLPFDGLIPALQAGTVDAAISGMTITAERAENVDFSNPYFKAGLAIAVREDNTTINSLEDLTDKPIAVQLGTTGAAEAAKVSSNITTFDSAPLALQELANGNVEAVVNDAPVTLYAINTGNLAGLKVVGELVTEEFYGIALPQDSEQLEVINTALAALIANGTYAEIYQQWFGTEPPELPATSTYTP